MAGSFNHVVDKQGVLRKNSLLDHMGDAAEAIEEMYGMIWYLADIIANEQSGSAADASLYVEDARQNYKKGLEVAPSEEPFESNVVFDPPKGVDRLPKMGEIVRYTFTAEQARSINRRRRHARQSHFADQETGAMIHVGDVVTTGDVYPLFVIKSSRSGAVSGQVFLNGNDSFWVEHAYVVNEVESPYGHWFWPEDSDV